MPVEIIEELAIKNNPAQAVAASERIGYTAPGVANVKEALDKALAAGQKPFVWRDSSDEYHGFDTIDAAFAAIGSDAEGSTLSIYVRAAFPAASVVCEGLKLDAVGAFVELGFSGVSCTLPYLFARNISFSPDTGCSFDGSFFNCTLNNLLPLSGTTKLYDCIVTAEIITGSHQLVLYGRTQISKSVLDAFVLQGGTVRDERVTLTSPDGTIYALAVSNAGVLSAAVI